MDIITINHEKENNDFIGINYEKENNEFETLYQRAIPFIDEGEMWEMLTSVKTGSKEALDNAVSKLKEILPYIEQQEEVVQGWRDRGATFHYGDKVKYHNALYNMEKYELLKRYYELKKEGLIPDEGVFDYYEDTADWALENLSNKDLMDVIANAEDTKARVSLKFAKAKQIVEF
jgi:DNA-directed RNA polymerase alpha subunit